MDVRTDDGWGAVNVDRWWWLYRLACRLGKHNLSCAGRADHLRQKRRWWHRYYCRGFPVIDGTVRSPYAPTYHITYTAARMQADRLLQDHGDGRVVTEVAPIASMG